MRPLLALLLLIAACAKSPAPAAPEPAFARRTFPAGVLERRGIAYSGYRTGQSPDTQTFPSEAEIRQDLDLVLAGGWQMIRLFDSGEHARRVLRVIRAGQLDLKVYLGTWIAGGAAAHDAANRAEIERTVALVKEYPELIVAVSVGNETLDDWSSVRTPPADLATYIRAVRARVGVPVTTDDAWQPFALVDAGKTSYADCKQVLETIDFVGVHVYAFAEAYYGQWDWKSGDMVAGAIAYTKGRVKLLREVLVREGLAMPILLTETGWKSFNTHTEKPDDAVEEQLADPERQKVFFAAMMAWIYGDARDADSPAGGFYFEAFDEPWKDQFNDDGWGLWDVERRPKPVISSSASAAAPPR